MIESELEVLKYPVGKFKRPSAFSKDEVQKFIKAGPHNVVEHLIDYITQTTKIELLFGALFDEEITQELKNHIAVFLVVKDMEKSVRNNLLTELTNQAPDGKIVTPLTEKDLNKQ